MILALAGCGDVEPATLMVDVRTDFVPGREFVRVRNVLESGATRDLVVREGLDFIDGLRAAEMDLTTEPGSRILETQLIREDGTVVASRRTSFVADGIVSVTVVLARGCGSGDCPTSCSNDTNCTTDVGCAVPRCREGTCFVVPRRVGEGDACSSDEWCSVAAGMCLPIGMTEVPPPPPPEEHPTAFRATQMDLTAPHLSVRAGAGYCFCADGTGTINDRFNGEIDALERNVMHVFRPLDPEAGTNDYDVHVSGRCEGTTCRASSDPPASTRAVHASGGYESEETEITLDIEGAALDFTNVRVAATFSEDGLRLLAGTMTAWLSEEAARAAMVPSHPDLCDLSTIWDILPGGGGCQGGDERVDLDSDGTPDGWWFTFSFEADRVDWMESATAAIHNGVRETGEPWVVAVSYERPSRGTIRLCTGSLIAPNAVLTAKHCVYDDTGATEWAYLPPSAFTVSVTSDAREPAADERGVIEVHTTPGNYTRDDALAGDDIALLILDSDLGGVTPTPISRTPAVVGRDVTMIGFGVTDTGELGAKHTGRAQVVEVTSVFHTEGESWTCTGDSGGPALDDLSGTIIGVASYGPASCPASDSVYTRVDRHLALIDDALGSGPIPTPDAGPPMPGTDSGPGPEPTPDAGAGVDGGPRPPRHPGTGGRSGGCCSTIPTSSPPPWWLSPLFLLLLAQSARLRIRSSRRAASGASLRDAAASQ